MSAVSPADEEILDLAQVPDIQHPTILGFWEACRVNDIEVALQLASDQEPTTLTFGLNDALRLGYMELARQLLDNGAKWDWNTMKIASKSLSAITMIVDRGFNVNTPLAGGNTVFCMAITEDNESVIRYLLERGANPNLGCPRYVGWPLNQIRPVPDSGRALNKAAAVCTTEIVALMIQHGAVLSNSAALHYALGVRPTVPPGERIPMLEYLVGMGLDINAMDHAIGFSENGRGQKGTPLHYAVLWGRVEEAKWLLKHGADPDLRTPWGGSARDRVERRFSPDHELAILFRAT